MWRPLAKNIYRRQIPFCQTRYFATRSFDPNPTSDAAQVGEVILVTKRGVDILNNPLFNKGTGFPMDERERLGIRGLVPPVVLQKEAIMETQVARIVARYNQLPDPLLKYQFLNELQDRNETLFYRVLIDYLEEMAPIIYTPTVGAACQTFGSIFRRPRGMYFSAADKGQMHAMAYNWPEDDVHIIVVTDGSRILGLGDLGAHGMGIPIGKLSLYTAGAGLHPSRCLPVVIDVGTNNEKLLNDRFYLGLRQKRLTGDAYLEVIQEFVAAVKERWPNVLIQFEDFSNENAARLLDHYRHKILCFNDDIQGTGTVTLAGVLSSLRAIGKDPKALVDQRIVISGAGSAGIGVAKMILFAMKRMGLTEEEAYKRFYLIDAFGLLGRERKDIQDIQFPWASRDLPDRTPLLDVVKHVKPTILIGCTGVGGIWTRDVIEEMAKHVARPIIFPLSNPTVKSECTAKQAFEWTKGQAIVATGSPFEPVTVDGKKCYPSQANNMYTFPGLGLGAIACRATSVTDGMLYAASLALAESVPQPFLKEGKIYPRLKNIREVSVQIATAVCNEAFETGVAKLQLHGGRDALKQAIQHRVWDPKYGSIVWVSEIPSFQHTSP